MVKSKRIVSSAAAIVVIVICVYLLRTNQIHLEIYKLLTDLSKPYTRIALKRAKSAVNKIELLETSNSGSKMGVYKTIDEENEFDFQKATNLRDVIGLQEATNSKDIVELQNAQFPVNKMWLRKYASQRDRVELRKAAYPVDNLSYSSPDDIETNSEQAVKKSSSEKQYRTDALSGSRDNSKTNYTSPAMTMNDKLEKMMTLIKHNLTLVTAYWDLGTFQKGSSKKFTKKLYMKWAGVFEYITNPLVVFTDSKEFQECMGKLRVKFQNNTRIIKVNRTSLWPFELVEQIRSVYSQPGYPKHHPNTVLPEYSSAQHAKYATVALTIKKKYFDTPFYAWLDVGYFRNLINEKQYFSLYPPKNLHTKLLAMNQVYNVKMNISPVTIFQGNQVWVGGGFFVGKRDTILKFEALYKKAVLYFLDEKLMNTDQQVIYALYSKEGRKALKPDVELQLYLPKGKGNPWFYLGFHCRFPVEAMLNLTSRISK